MIIVIAKLVAKQGLKATGLMKVRQPGYLKHRLM